MCTELEWDGGNNTAQMSTCSLYQEGNAILMKNPPNEGIVDVGVTKYRSYLFLAVALWLSSREQQTRGERNGASRPSCRVDRSR